jgi:hypothetical protein
MTENQQRFLKAIADRIPAARIAEVRLFPTVRQGHVESAVAVVAVEAPDKDAEREVPLASTPGDFESRTEEHPFGEIDLGFPQALDTPSATFPADSALATSPDQRSALRYAILTARYSLTLKGPDRGKWDFEVVHDADAPLDAMERVARGMAHRVGEDGEPDLLSAAEFQRAVTEPWWSK